MGLARSKERPKLGWFRALGRYYRDPSASAAGKLIIFLAMIYVVMPVDLIPDVPLIGWLDDIGVMGLATAWLARIVARYRVLSPSDGRSEAEKETVSGELAGLRRP
jgi:uncharacterized membrane protein YkvA (DUF1232 family)